ncbi:MAG: carboxypeptidase-like regulatory domain-containing protein [Candidatus Sericytochromatia bacterium]
MRALLLLSTLLPALYAAPAIAQSAAEPVRGRIVDAETGQPVKDAFIRQDGGVGSAFSGPDGRFALRWEASGGDSLLIRRGGYQIQTVPRAALAEGPVRLEPLVAYRAAGAAPPQAPAASPFATQLHADYMLFRTDYATPAGTGFGGFGVHGLRLGGEVRHGDLFGALDLGRSRVPVEVAGLAAHENPAFAPETWDARLLSGRRFHWRGLALGPGLGYRLWRYDPHNRDVPYSNTPLDFRQTAHMLGLGLTAETEAAGLRLKADGRYYPLALAFADPGDPAIAARGGWQAEVLVSREAAPGLFPSIGYRVEGWRADRVHELSHYLFARIGFQPAAQ